MNKNVFLLALTCVIISSCRQSNSRLIPAELQCEYRTEPFEGKELQSGREYFWKVMVYDKDGKPSKWSKPAHFVTGIPEPAEWDAAAWIRHPGSDGYRHFAVRPFVVDEVDFAEAPIAFPASHPDRVAENGNPPDVAEDLTQKGFENGYAKVRALSGKYRFEIMNS
jgi:hypothetical protein